MSEPLTRRRALQRALTTLTALPAGVLLGCGSLDCSDTSTLAPADVEARRGQNYLDTSPDPAKRCDHCDHYVVPPNPKTCGGCKVLKGNIAAGGSCALFVPKA